MHESWPRLRVADLAEQIGLNPKRKERGGLKGVAVDCPSRHDHTDPSQRKGGLRKLFAVNWNDTREKRGPSLKCKHGCTSRHSGWMFLDLMLVEYRARKRKESVEVTDAELLDIVRNFYDKRDDTVDPKTGRKRLYSDVTAETQFALGTHGPRNGRPLPTERNLFIALKRINVRIRKNEFRNFDLIEGYDGFDEILNDETMTALRLHVAREFDLTIGKDQFYDFIEAFGLHDAFHPVRDYLDEVELKWDGVSRIEVLASKYFGGEDTPLSRAMSECFVVAAVRRIRKPGTKHDVALVFESETQGWGKSSGIQALAGGPEYFTDDLPVGSELQGSDREDPRRLDR